MKWLKRLAIAFAALLLLVAVLLWWLLDTGAGLRFALARAEGAMHGALTVKHAQGRLLGPLDVSGVHYDDGNGTVVMLAKAHLEWRFWPLLGKRLHVINLDVDGVDVALPKASEETPPSSGGFSLKPPIALVLDRVHVVNAKISQGGQPLFAANQLDLAASWTNTGIAVKQLGLQSPDGHAELVGQLAVGRRYKGDGKASIAWRVGDTEYAGTLTATSDGKQAHAQIALTKPTTAALTLDLTQSSQWPWTAKLDLPSFDPKPLLGVSSLQTLAAHLSGSGDKLGGTLNGQLDLNHYTVRLQPLSAHFDSDYKTLQLQQVQLSSPQVPGTLNASGTLQLDAKPVSGNLAITWKNLQLPAELVGQALASHGSLTAHGS
ncbi:MAG: pathogenicity protein, partial [Rhodanobacter sp.]